MKRPNPITMIREAEINLLTLATDACAILSQGDEVWQVTEAMEDTGRGVPPYRWVDIIRKGDDLKMSLFLENKTIRVKAVGPRPIGPYYWTGEVPHIGVASTSTPEHLARHIRSRLPPHAEQFQHDVAKWRTWATEAHEGQAQAIASLASRSKARAASFDSRRIDGRHWTAQVNAPDRIDLSIRDIPLHQAHKILDLVDQFTKEQ